FQVLSERQPRGEHLEFAFQICAHLWVFGFGLRNQVSQAGHKVSLLFVESRSGLRRTNTPVLVLSLARIRT
ncbi:hypothetical protein, partial [Dokdonella sp.]|uniref:hypothetical protein n=1 Tax=Dokdonella sp. TaxID=2291710 RepID=UPI002CCB586A